LQLHNLDTQTPHQGKKDLTITCGIFTALNGSDTIHFRYISLAQRSPIVLLNYEGMGKVTEKLELAVVFATPVTAHRSYGMSFRLTCQASLYVST
jgi:hypothetical protein